MTHDTKDLGTLMAGLQDSPKKPGPLINYEAPANDVEAVELFAKARAGDVGEISLTAVDLFDHLPAALVAAHC